MEPLPVLGARRTGYRRGRYDVKGTIKGYWLNSTLRAMFLGAPNPTSLGTGSVIYQSQASFTRYQIAVVPTSVFAGFLTPPILFFINVLLEKDAVKWTADKLTTEDISFVAEDIIGQ